MKKDNVIIVVSNDKYETILALFETKEFLIERGYINDRHIDRLDGTKIVWNNIPATIKVVDFNDLNTFKFYTDVAV